MTTKVRLHFVELADNASAPAWGKMMGVPISNITDDRYDLFYSPNEQVVLATLKVNISASPTQTVAYPCSNVKSMCFSTEDQPDEQPESVPPPSSKRHKVKVEAEPEELPAYMREMK